MDTRTRHYLDLIIILTQKEMKVRYKSSFLGYLWCILLPLAFALVYFIAFKVILKVEIENFTLFLLAGIFPWQWFANSANMSPMAFVGNVTLIKKVSFPKYLIPFAVVLQEGIHFVLSLPVLLLFLLYYNKSPSLTWLYGIPLLLFIQFMMVYGISLLISVINLFFRDMEKLTGIFVTLFFFLTPIVYSETMVPEKYKPVLVTFNPFCSLIVSWRNLILDGTMDPAYVATSLFFALSFLIMGYLVYNKLSWRIAEVV